MSTDHDSGHSCSTRGLQAMRRALQPRPRGPGIVEKQHVCPLDVVEWLEPVGVKLALCGRDLAIDPQVGSFDPNTVCY